jgi:transposase
METKDKVIKLRKEGKSYDEIKKELNISKSTISYHCKRYGLNSERRFDIEELKNYCKTHTIKEASEKFNVSISTVKKYKDRSYSESKSNSQSVIEWRRRVKIRLVEYKGGECELCGYNKCISSLEFHHRNPKEKDFSVSGKTHSFEKLKNEVDKCILVCRNCHGEIHYNIEEEKRLERLR